MEKIIGYAKAKTLMQEGCTVREVPQFRGAGIPYIRKPDGTRFENGTLDLRIRSDSWDKLRRECHMTGRELGAGKRSGTRIWAYGDEVIEPKRETTPEPEKAPEEPALMLYTFGCNTYAGKLVTIQIPAMNREFAGQMARQMMNAAREVIDIDEGLWLNDEEPY